MAYFTEEDVDKSELDWLLMKNGAVTLYLQSAILDGHLAWLGEHRYQIETINCHDITTFQHEMSLALKFKEQFGYGEWNGNLNALNDGFRHVESASEYGLVLCFIRYDSLAAADPDFALAILDIIESSSRDHLLFGRRLLALVQSDDPKSRFYPLGARAANWNVREWLNKNRGL
jgi:hypothetical protein